MGRRGAAIVLRVRIAVCLMVGVVLVAQCGGAGSVAAEGEGSERTSVATPPPRVPAGVALPESDAPLPPREHNLAPEGSSLRSMINSQVGVVGDAGDWEVYFDEDSGHPYYHNVHTGVTQWDNPFSSDPTEDGLWDSWLLYEGFEFVGMFDQLLALVHRDMLPRSGENDVAVATIESLAEASFDVAQAKLEVAVYKAEANAFGGTLPVREDWASMGSRNAEGAHQPASPPADTTPEQRVALAGAWNDLGNIWYARGEWEMTLNCFRKSLFWNPEQTSTLLNMVSVLSALGFERDGAVVLEYYDSVGGGTMGGWTPEKEANIRQSVQRGLDYANRPLAANTGGGGLTRGELQLEGIDPDTALPWVPELDDSHEEPTTMQNGAVQSGQHGDGDLARGDGTLATTMGRTAQTASHTRHDSVEVSASLLTDESTEDSARSPSSATARGRGARSQRANADAAIGVSAGVGGPNLAAMDRDTFQRMLERVAPQIGENPVVAAGGSLSLVGQGLVLPLAVAGMVASVGLIALWQCRRPRATSAGTARQSAADSVASPPRSTKATKKARRRNNKAAKR